MLTERVGGEGGMPSHSSKMDKINNRRLLYISNSFVEPSNTTLLRYSSSFYLVCYFNVLPRPPPPTFSPSRPTYQKFLAALRIFMHRIRQIGSHLNRAVKVALVLASTACYKF